MQQRQPRFLLPTPARSKEPVPPLQPENNPDGKIKKRRALDRRVVSETNDALRKENLDLQTNLNNHARLLEQLTNLPEENAIQLLRDVRNRTTSDAASMVSVHGAMHGQYRPSDLATAKSLFPATDSLLEFELSVRHNFIYPKTPPLDPAKLVAFLNSSALTATDELSKGLSSPQTSSTSSVLSRRSLATSQSRPSSSTADTSVSDTATPETSETYQLCDPRLGSLEIKFWTSVPIPNTLAASAISFYLESDHPIFGIFDADLFLTDLVEKRLIDFIPIWTYHNPVSNSDDEFGMSGSADVGLMQPAKSDGGSDAFTTPLSMSMGRTFQNLCGFWTLMQEVFVVYNRLDPRPLRERVSLAFAEAKYQKLLAWSDGVESSVSRGEHSPGHVLIFHLLFHGMVIQLFSPFMSEEIGYAKHKLQSFSSKDGCPAAIIAASLNHMGYLMFQFQQQYASATWSTYINPPLVQLADAMLNQRFRNAAGRRLFFLLCVRGWVHLYRSFRVFWELVKGFAARALKERLISSHEARRLLKAVRRQGYYHEVPERALSNIIIDFNLAEENPKLATIKVIAEQFEDLALHEEFTTGSFDFADDENKHVHLETVKKGIKTVKQHLNSADAQGGWSMEIDVSRLIHE
ncbi:hypothetical protein E4U43_003667 [Claviceps pusilla]|uniref:Uncharacterized protein n=1 Tax=Claviceps pusilla TaxID=123648 RepID=A0A9P7T0H0_9HYPO|nr:hypothetical protein E4U43_003667 [Claviceps pusilla]